MSPVSSSGLPNNYLDLLKKKKVQKNPKLCVFFFKGAKSIWYSLSLINSSPLGPLGTRNSTGPGPAQSKHSSPHTHVCFPQLLSVRLSVLRAAGHRGTGATTAFPLQVPVCREGQELTVPVDTGAVPCPLCPQFCLALLGVAVPAVTFLCVPPESGEGMQSISAWMPSVSQSHRMTDCLRGWQGPLEAIFVSLHRSPYSSSHISLVLWIQLLDPALQVQPH